MDATAGAVQRGMIMKIEEAIEILKKDIYTDIPRSAIGARNHNTAVAMAIAVLEKSIPVKPIIPDQLNGDIDYDCPLCGRQTMSDKESLGNYCSECGRRFDWSGIDEIN